MQDFRKLQVWQKAHALSLRADRLADRLRSRKPNLASQIERSADSVPANIAEGRAADTEREFARFLTIGIRSITEFENHLERAGGGGMVNDEEFDSLIADAIEVRRMLVGLRKRLRGEVESSAGPNAAT